MTKMTVESILAAGYRQFHDATKARTMGDWYRASYQKRITDQYGVRYFITIGHSVMPPRPLVDDADPGRTESNLFSPDNQFRRDDLTFNVEMLHHEESIEQVEAFFADLWEKMRLDYYEEYSSDT